MCESELNCVLLETLLEKERHSPSIQLQKADSIVSEEERNNEVIWLCSVAEKQGLGLDTIYLAVAILDRLLTITRVQQKYLNCVALSCLYLAIKICEELDGFPELKVLLRRLNSTYSVTELMRMEVAILSKVGWDLGMVTVHRFLQTMLSMGGLEMSAEMRQSLESVLANYALISKYRPSLLALALLSLTLETSAVNDWLTVTFGLQKRFQIDQSELISCRESMSAVIGCDEKENVASGNQKARKRQRLSSASLDAKNSRLKTNKQQQEMDETMRLLSVMPDA